MSQAAPGPVCAAPAPAAILTSSEHTEIREYEKIIQFRDTVVSGKHPRIKVPASAVVKNASSSVTQPSSSNAPGRVAQSSIHSPIGNTTTTITTTTNGHSVGNVLSFKANSQRPAVTIPASSAPFIPGVSRPAIDPILLQKSDGLVKAEIQLQRQRIETVLKDQVEERKATIRSNNQNSELPELDISDILAKALTLVQATAPVTTPILPSATANASDASDSFDENTFYSSQHDTPESRPSVPARNASEIQNAPIVALQRDTHASSSESLTSHPLPASIIHPPRTEIARNITHGQTMGTQGAYPPVGPNVPVQIRSAIGAPRTETRNLLNQDHQRGRLEAQVISSDSRDASRSDNSGNTDSEQSADQHGLQNPPQLVSNPNFRQHDEPLIRGHNLSPFAPQPAHVSPLAAARQPSIRESDTSASQRVPAQVTALRQEHAVVISPESSPLGDKGSKKKNKKKKRKADARAQDAQGSPNIKPEPRSPSPLTAPPFIRPQKRPRRFGEGEPEIIYDEPIPDRPSSRVQEDRYTLPVHVERSQGYERVDDPYSRQVRPSVGPVSRRLESPVYEERMSDGSFIRYVRRVPSPSGYADPYGAVDTRPMRTASYSVANPNIRDVPTYHREGRMSVRPYADRARSRSPILVERHSSVMPPPSAPPRRIVIDAYDHEYAEPVRTLSRQSVVPPPRPGEHEVVYERAPIRATSRIPAPEIVGEDGVVYRRASPGYVPRRVITQPDYGTGFRSYRERDYPVQSMAPPSHEFVQIRGAAEHVSREYLPRAASVRPVEPMPYDRLTSTRPDIPPRQYTASVRPDVREVAPHVARAYSVRPTEMEIPQRAYSVRPVERYYEQPPREGEVTYVERPRVVHQEIIYPGDGTPRQVYQ